MSCSTSTTSTSILTNNLISDMDESINNNQNIIGIKSTASIEKMDNEESSTTVVIRRSHLHKASSCTALALDDDDNEKGYDEDDISSDEEDDKMKEVGATKRSMALNETMTSSPLDFSITEKQRQHQNIEEKEEKASSDGTTTTKSINNDIPFSIATVIIDESNSTTTTPPQLEEVERTNSSVVKSAIKSLELIERYSHIFKFKKYDSLPTFSKRELIVGKLLGAGSYSSVYEISSIRVDSNGAKDAKQEASSSLDSKDREEQDYCHSKQNKKFIAQHCRRSDIKNNDNNTSNKKDGDARYAIKFLKPETMSHPIHYQRGAVDIAREGAILSSLSHPNIIKLRGLSSPGLTGFEVIKPGNYFLILDRLYDTLEQRLEKWAVSSGLAFTQNIKSLFGSSPAKMKKKRMLLVNRLLVAYDLAQALRYLHARNIIYRDLKPENVGFDVRGEVKLFDFGLALELHPKQKLRSGLYNLAGNVGTPRYMSSEVMRNKPYNLSCDVYSFSILLWQICTLKIPFAEYFDVEPFYQDISVYNKRPMFNKKQNKLIPTQLQQLIKSSWSENIFERPTISTLILKLKDEIESLQSENDDNNTNQCIIASRDDRYYRRRSSTGMIRKLSISSQDS